MPMDSAKKSELLKQIKYGRRMGALNWARILLISVAAWEIIQLVEDTHHGKGNLVLVVDGLVMVFILAVAAMGLGTLDMSERFAALLELIGEESPRK